MNCFGVEKHEKDLKEGEIKHGSKVAQKVQRNLIKMIRVTFSFHVITNTLIS